MLASSAVGLLRFLAIAASFTASLGCSGRLASTDDDPCSACQIGTSGTGTCQADNVAVGQYGPSAIAVAGSKVFWTNYGRGQPGDAMVMKTDRHGGDPVALAVNQESARAIAVDADNVYWVSGDVSRQQDIFRVGHDGGVPALLAHAGRVEQLVVHGSILYWTEGIAVRSVPIEGGTVTTIAADEADARGLAVDDAHVYWSTFGNAVVGGGVFRAPIHGGDRTILAQSPGLEFWALALNETFLFVTEFADGSIWKMAKEGSSVEVLPLDMQPWALAVDASRVYWTGGAGVRTIDLATGTATAFDTPAPPFLLTVDETRVFWTSIGQGDDNNRVRDGSVWSMCKPR